MSSADCPYCGCEHFDAAAAQEPENEQHWINRCRDCRLYSYYDEADGEQHELDATRRETG